jgi:putative ABC transport system permease protein
MLFWMIVKVALKSLSANKLRSILAMLGIIIGVGAVIAMLAIGAGAQQSVLARFTAMGTNLLVIRPGQRGTGGVMSGTAQDLTVDDAEQLLKVPGVMAVAPVVSKSVQVKFSDQNTQTSLLGTSPTYLPIRDFHIASGRMFTDSDIDQWARVAVIGPVTATNLFGISDPVDQIIKVNGINFHVTGVLVSKGDQGWFNPDDQVIIPYSTAMHIVLGVTNLREVDVEAENGADVNVVQSSITDVLRKLHRIQPGYASDFNIQNQADLIAGATEATQIFKILLGSVAGISLFVGGIGIMNIMLVTVTERTREIGIRKAIGARDYDILSQFLIEALLMCGVGGLTGVAIGVGAAAAIAKFTRLPSIVQPFSIILALTVSAAVGIFFGYYPALRASKLDPIEALRYE